MNSGRMGHDCVSLTDVERGDDDMGILSLRTVLLRHVHLSLLVFS